MTNLLSGNEAIALGFIHAQGKFVSGYPGTPSTEIIETLAKHKDVYSEWAPNEKVAVESCIGASFAGLRAIAVMKHVGVNVASDPIFTLAYTGCNAGLIIITADDPGMHSSQNEQDNRWYSKSAKIPMFEPSDSQECYDFIKVAFEISEQFQTPVFIRLTTRISHSKSLVKYSDSILKANYKPIQKDIRFNPIPEISKKLHCELENKLNKISSSNNYYSVEYSSNKDIGIITSGISYQYTKEVFKNDVSILKLNLIYPLNKDIIKDFADKLNNVYIIEELDGFIEAEVKNFGIKCIGKEIIPNTLELSPNILKKAFGIKQTINNNINTNDNCSKNTNNGTLSFCSGCPYRPFFYALSKYKDLIVSSDIGCYALSSYDPFNTKDIALCMGAGFSIAHGIQKSFELTKTNKKCIGIMGDSTFFHSGINSLINSIYNKSNPFLVILDNSSTSMTGLQDNPGTGKTISDDYTIKIDIEQIVKAVGVKNVKLLNSTLISDINNAINWGLSFDTTSVLIYKNECKLKEMKHSNKLVFPNFIDTTLCTVCKKCIKIGCPSIKYISNTNLVSIDSSTCVGCNTCTQLCPNNAIKKVVL